MEPYCDLNQIAANVCGASTTGTMDTHVFRNNLDWQIFSQSRDRVDVLCIRPCSSYTTFDNDAPYGYSLSASDNE